MNDQVREFRKIQIIKEQRALNTGKIHIPHSKNKHAYTYLQKLTTIHCVMYKYNNIECEKYK